MEEIKKVVMALKNNKCPGIDGLPVEILIGRVFSCDK